MTANDADRVRAIERKAELRLLERLLAERERPVPPAPPRRPPFDPTLRQHLIDLMLLIAETLHNDYPRNAGNVVDFAAAVHTRSTASSREITRPSSRSAQAI